MPGIITGPKTGVCRMTNATYSITAVPRATSYFWTVPSGAVIVSGQGTTTILVNYSTAFISSGLITVSASNTCGVSAVRTATVFAAAATPVIIGSNTTCQSQTGVAYSVTPVIGATSYTWTVVSGSTIVSGQGTSSIIVNWGPISGVIKCKANNACGSSFNGTLSVSFTCKQAGESFEISEIDLYPNPASGTVVLDFDAFVDGNATIAIMDMVGKSVRDLSFEVTEGNNKYNFDVAGIARGTYMVKVTCEGTTRIVRLMVQ